ncbi:hypothetical protein ACQPZX_22960 [Actinoplanes sp. CA-142083]|uniref:hypothetical protein n=1 Tax=Actinoplanes sp. CA-142083 TaxID=3239903 RepID=UPI003D8FDE3C
MQPSRTVAVVEISAEKVTFADAVLADLARPAAGDEQPCRWLHLSDPGDLASALRAAEPGPDASWQMFRIPFARIVRSGMWGPTLSEQTVIVHVTDNGVVSLDDDAGPSAVESARAQLRDSRALRAAGPMGVVAALLLEAVASIGTAHAAVAESVDRAADDGGQSPLAADLAFLARQEALKLHGLARRLTTEWSRLPAGITGTEMATAMTEVTILGEWSADVWSFAQGKAAMYLNETMARLAAWSLSAVVPSILIALVSLIAAVSPAGRNPIFLWVAAVTIAGVSLGVYAFLRRRRLL